jgi:hypothetical protein
MMSSFPRSTKEVDMSSRAFDRFSRPADSMVLVLVPKLAVSRMLANIVLQLAKSDPR